MPLDLRQASSWLVPAWRELLALGAGLVNLAENHEATEAFVRRNLVEAGATTERIGHMMQNLAAKIAAKEPK